MAVELGPFEITERFATGGMGEIWKGVHLEQNVPVAIKVITGPNALLPSYQDEFRREAQAVARLNHPNIVQVFDYGILPQSVEALPGLLPKSPYLVMEYASKGSLATQMEPVNWRDLKNILMSVLGGLSHAHARGLVHRDIKPGNVLLGSLHETPPRIILTDFGVAHVVDSNTRTDAMDLTSRSTEEASGTPRYMAPEQFMGKWRDYGPGTDLYAVGIMAYQLASGELPFKAATFMMLAMAHINSAMPELTPRIAVPDGFDEWIRRMTMKKSADRFQSAADAVWALTQLNDSQLLFSELSNIAGRWDVAEDDDYDSTDVLPTRIEFALPEALRIFTMSRTAQQQRRYADAPVLPLTWQEAEPPQQHLSLVGAGLGLFGLRSIPVVDREEIRQTLWESFKSVYLDGKPKAVVLKGLAGSGKSRLAEWLSQFTEEIGASSVLHTTHAAMPGVMHGIGWMLTRHFRSAGLSADDMRERVATFLSEAGSDDEYEVRALTEIMRSHIVDTQTSQFVRFTSPDQRYVIVQRVLERLAKRRPLVVILDDAQYGWDSIEFVVHTLNSPDITAPILFVLAVQEEALGQRTEEIDALKNLLSLPNAQEVAVPPLAHEHIMELTTKHLGLPENLATDIARRAAGSPLFAVQLVEDWVKRGILVIEGAHLVLRAGETATFPQDLSAIWESRVDYLIDQLSKPSQPLEGRVAIAADPKRVRATIEIAAALGQDVQIREWEMACARAGVQVVPGTIDELVRLRLATCPPGSENFSFINKQLRDVLIDSAKEAGRSAAHNTVCAQVLTSLYDDDQPGLALRVGRHFLEARSFMLALTCLEAAHQRAQGAPEQRDTAEIVDLVEATYRAMNMRESDPRWAELWVRRGVPLIYSEDPVLFQQGIDLLAQAEAVARQGGNRPILASILRAQAWASVYSRVFDEGLQKIDESLSIVAGDPIALASCHRTRGHILYHQGESAEAEPEFLKTIELAPESIHAVWAHLQLGDCASRTGRLEEAQRSYDTALERAKEMAIVMAEAQVYESEGGLGMQLGDFETAESKFREALRIRELLSGKSSLQTRGREFVARVLLAQKRFDEANELLDGIRSRLEKGSRALFIHPHDAQLVCAAARGDWKAWDLLIEPATQFEHVTPEFTHVFTLQLAVAIAAHAEQEDRAQALSGIIAGFLDPELIESAQRVVGMVSLDARSAPIPVMSQDDEPGLREESEPEVFDIPQRGVVNYEDALAAINDSSGQFEPYHDDYYDDSESEIVAEGPSHDLDDSATSLAPNLELPDLDEVSELDLDGDENQDDDLSDIQDDFDELEALEVPSASRLKAIFPVPPVKETDNED